MHLKIISMTCYQKNFQKKSMKLICDDLCDLVPFVQFKRREKHPYRSDTFSKVTGFSLQIIKIINIPWVFSMFFKLCKWYQIVQSISFDAILG